MNISTFCGKAFSAKTTTILLAGLLLGISPMSATAQSISWDPHGMTFPDTPIGETRTLTLVIFNEDSALHVSIDQIEWTWNQPGEITLAPQFAFVADRPMPTSLLPGEEMAIDILFTPETAFSIASANLLITNTSTNASPLEYWVDGMGSEVGSCDPLSSCAGICIDLQNDLNNCGSCGNVCPVPSVGLAVCNAGVCGYVCDESIDLSSDPQNCGSCDNVCDTPMHSTSFCEDGSCGFVCDEGYEPVGDGCQASVTQTPEELMDALLAFVLESSDTGALLGLGPSGRNQAGEAKLNVFVMNIEKANELFDLGTPAGMTRACGFLNFSQLRSDGGWPFIMPPDLVAGEATSEVYDRIIELMGLIEGCEPTEAPTRP